MFDNRWGEQVKRLRFGELDVAPGLNETPDRLETFTFTEPYIEYYSADFTRRDRTDINSPEDLAGKTVALEDGYAITRNLPNDRPDIKDFTRTTEDMQPEDLTALLNSYFTEMSAIALEYGATIDKFIGDAMLMFFGDPEGKGVKKDAELCVRMAPAMQKRMVELEKEWRSQGGDKPFKMRVGVNTGYCNVGNFGSEARTDYIIVGGEVNLAARQEGQADPGGVLISPETYGLVRGIMSVEEREPIHAKGIRKEIRPYAIMGLRGEKDADSGEVGLARISDDGVDLSVDFDAVPGEKRRELGRRMAEIAKHLQGG